VKTSRVDFLGELKHPLKRRMGMRYSNEFYFVTPARLVEIAEIPAECGLIEAFSFDPGPRQYCLIAVPAPVSRAGG
jgi:hypothetical protein